MTNEPEIWVNGQKMESMEEFDEVMNEISGGLVKYTKQISQQFNVSLDTAVAIVYLRGRSRWTQEKEDELIHRDKAGNPISIGTVLSGEF